MNEPSKVTKVLISKIHGGRKQDSKFWKSSFDNNSTPSKPPKKRHTIHSFYMSLLILLAVSIVAYGGYYIVKSYYSNSPNVNLIHENAILTKSNNYSHKTTIYTPPKHKAKPNRTSTTKKSNISTNYHSPKKDINKIYKKDVSPYYQIELNNGSIIKAKSATEDKNHFTIKNTDGLIFSLRRNDIKNVKKIYPE